MGIPVRIQHCEHHSDQCLLVNIGDKVLQVAPGAEVFVNFENERDVVGISTAKYTPEDPAVIEHEYEGTETEDTDEKTPLLDEIVDVNTFDESD